MRRFWRECIPALCRRDGRTSCWASSRSWCAPPPPPPGGGRPPRPPLGCAEASLGGGDAAKRYNDALAALETASPDGGALEAACDTVRQLLLAARPPADALAKLAAAMPPGARCVVRSSANVEDLAGMSGAGLYDSITGVNAGDAAALGAAVASVWASLHTRRAVLARRAAGVPQAAAAMAVLVQEMVPVQHCFVLHTAAPGRPDAVLAEIAVGLGETLASGTQGAGWRLEADAAGKVRTLAFANLSTALLPGAAPGAEVRTATVDYSAQPLSGPPEARAALGARLGAVGRALQAALGDVAQDVEGGVVADGRLFVVQSRPQPM